jgi:hypothetical protein
LDGGFAQFVGIKSCTYDPNIFFDSITPAGVKNGNKGGKLIFFWVNVHISVKKSLISMGFLLILV